MNEKKGIFSPTISVGKNEGQIVVVQEMEKVIQNINRDVSINENNLIEIKDGIQILKEKISELVPLNSRDDIDKKIDELEKALLKAKPDWRKTMKIIEWLKAKFPKVAKFLISSIINPLMTKIAGVTGDIAVEELKRLLTG